MAKFADLPPFKIIFGVLYYKKGQGKMFGSKNCVLIFAGIFKKFFNKYTRKVLTCRKN